MEMPVAGQVNTHHGNPCLSSQGLATQEKHIPIKPSHKLDVNPQLELVSVHLLQVRGKTKNFLNYRVYQPFLNLPKCSSPN